MGVQLGTRVNSVRTGDDAVGCAGSTIVDTDDLKPPRFITDAYTAFSVDPGQQKRQRVVHVPAQRVVR